MSTRTVSLTTAAIVVAMLIASCGRKVATSPAPATFEPARVTSAISRLDRILAQPSFASFRAAGERLAPASPAGALWLRESELRAFAAAPSAERARVLARDVAERFRLARQARAAQPGWAVIAPQLYGKTLVYDPAQHRYVVDPAREGAPPNGIRYVLYAVDSVAHEPLLGQEIGRADLTDEGVALANGFSLRLRASTASLLFLDYAVTAQGNDQSRAIAVRGFMTDGESQANFHVDVNGATTQSGSAFALAFGLTTEPDGLDLATTIHAASAASADAGQMEQTVRLGGNVFQLTATQAGGVLHAAVAVNGRPFASIVGPLDHPSFLGADGQPLSPKATMALGQILGLADGVARLAGDLLQPIQALIAMSHPLGA